MKIRLCTLISFVLFSFPFLAAASALTKRNNNDNQCSSGTVQCCNTTQASTATVLAILSALFNLSLPNLSGLVGLGCTPVTVGASGNTCSSQPVCCTDNYVTGSFALGCNPINV